MVELRAYTPLEGSGYPDRYNNCHRLLILHTLVVLERKSRIEAVGIPTQLDGSFEACCRSGLLRERKSQPQKEEGIISIRDYILFQVIKLNQVASRHH